MSDNETLSYQDAESGGATAGDGGSGGASGGRNGLGSNGTLANGAGGVGGVGGAKNGLSSNRTSDADESDPETITVIEVSPSGKPIGRITYGSSAQGDTIIVREQQIEEVSSAEPATPEMGSPDGYNRDTLALLTTERGLQASAFSEERARRRRRCVEDQGSILAKVLDVLQSSRCLALVTLTALVLLTYIIIAYKIILPRMQANVKEKTILRANGSKEWLHPSGQAFMNVYAFNVTNPEEFEHGARPVVKEIGPYVYRLKISRVNTTWHSNGSVSFTLVYSTDIDLDLSVGPETDLVTSANTQLFFIADILNVSIKAIQNLTSLPASKLVYRSTVKSLFRGFDSNEVLDKLESVIRKLDVDHVFDGSYNTTIEINTTSRFDWTVYTGELDFNKFNHIYSVDWMTKLPFWSTDEANTFRGTDGYLFKPFLSEDSRLSFYFPQLFRSFELQYQEKSSHKSVDTLRFIVPDSEFSNSSTLQASPTLLSWDPRVWAEDLKLDPNDYRVLRVPQVTVTPATELVGNGYCTPDCVPSGAYSLVRCLEAPVYISLPHFLGADPYYRSRVHGLDPVESKHRPVFDLHAYSGIVTSQSRRFQYNLRMPENVVDDTTLPLYWIDTRIDVADHVMSAAELERQKNEAVYVINYIVMGIVIFCVLFIVISTIERAYVPHNEDNSSEHTPFCRPRCPS
ncbi:lysosome membrane protein 2-like [Physella acuta]|uniref:lysosome membrane protein 2-like n=1 Tax=Physella acuta TaxID=109671 RepID=UPI0027DD74A2|nr:lysosome membrane protein 2-like [Physella acuta]